MEQPAPQETLNGWRAILRDLAQMIRFYSRFPVSKLPFEFDAHALPDFTTAPRMVAIAGAIIGIPAALVLWLSASLGLPALLGASLAVTISVLVTGAFHEDGLADTFDGLAGGATKERRLDIMKDSRIGAFGGSALVLGMMLRVTALGGLLEETNANTAAMIIIAAASLSRSLGLTPLAILPNARPGGFSSSVGRPNRPAFVTTLMLSCVIVGMISHIIDMSLLVSGLVIGFVLLPIALISWWSLKTIEGQTGDIAGAAQQLAEIAFYIGLLVALNATHG